jgi:acyl-CoA thioesterase FadM
MTSAVLDVRVPPRHCDAQGMMHAARPHEYFEDAFLAWLDRECGGYDSLRAGGDDFVIVQSQCRYIAPARLGDRVDLAVRPVSVGKRSSFTVEVEMARDGQVLVRCSVTYVTVRDGRSAPIPGPLRQAMQAAGAPGTAQALPRCVEDQHFVSAPLEFITHPLDAVRDAERCQQA